MVRRFTTADVPDPDLQFDLPARSTRALPVNPA